MIRAPILPRPVVHRALTFAVILLCAVLAARGIGKGLRPGGNDFTIYYESARAVLEGRDPLAVAGSIYPPSFDVLLAPLGLLPYPLALASWNALSWLALLWSWRRSLELCGTALEARPWVPWVALLAVSRLADSTFAYGQVNTITLALTLEAAVRLRAGRELLAAQGIALGTALKLLAGVLCVWAWMRGSRRAAVLALVSIAVWTIVPPVIVLGPELARASLARWGRQVVGPVLAGGPELFAAREYMPGQSLQAACYRTFSDTPATSRGRAGPRANLFDWPLERTHRLIVVLTALQLAALVSTLARVRRGARGPQGPPEMLGALELSSRDGLALALTLTTILSVAPVVQKAHMVWLLLPYGLLLGLPSALSGAARRVREVLSWTSLLLVAATSPALLGDELATRLLSGNVVFLGLQCAWFALLVELWGRTRVRPKSG